MFFKSLKISFPNLLKLSGQVLILVALSMQLYVLTLESEVRSHIASHEATVAYHSKFINLAKEQEGTTIGSILDIAAKNHKKKLKRHEENFNRKAKKRALYIKKQGSFSFWAAISFIIGTILFALGEYENYRREYINKNN